MDPGKEPVNGGGAYVEANHRSHIRASAAARNPAKPTRLAAATSGFLGGALARA
jgi:hypothetical protein